MKTPNPNLSLVIGAAIALSGASLVLWSSAASALSAANPCATEFSAVQYAINGATFQGKNATTDRSNLLVKLEAADSKVVIGKLDDAIGKLEDISNKATVLVDQQKLLDAAAINNAVVAAIACVGTSAGA